ncbi:hypothetical protein OD757_02460 [Acinetobacter sp. AYS6]|uniref:hypothetical protein n=1 Tax=Acinetobacter sp. AYS6 TaxID=2983297 RepID=UPI0021D6814B|nr:hypothetical protein [Acinetobacter sp. AYS6]MCU7696091.1 hypothetical protein [Acinetobacter sp. AYS6]
MGSLNIQIIPLDLERNKNCVDSIAIDEIAFSLVEHLFNRDKNKYFHWGITFIGPETIIEIIEDLYKLHFFIAQSNKYDNSLSLIFKEETNFFAKKFLVFKSQVLKMILEIINFLKSMVIKKEGITVPGV